MSLEIFAKRDVAMSREGRVRKRRGEGSVKWRERESGQKRQSEVIRLMDGMNEVKRLTTLEDDNTRTKGIKGEMGRNNR